MGSFLDDIRYALRLSVREPGFTIVAVLALALGIGANTAIFTVVDAVLLERLPYKDPSRLVVLWEETARRPGHPNVVAPANFLRWKERATAFETMAALADSRVNLTGTGAPEELVVQYVTQGFFDVLGVEPLIGRTFNANELSDPGATVTVLGYALWQRRFGGDPGIIGRTIDLGGRPQVVVGVMPRDVGLLLKSGSLVGKPSDLWEPYVLPPEARQPRGRYLSVIARLRPGVSVEQARTQMETIAAGLRAELPQFDEGWTTEVRTIRDELSGDVRPALLVLAGAVAFVLLIACANVANLLLARGAARHRELAIRVALGAGRGRMVRQLLTESLVLAALGGAAGLLVAQWGVALMLALTPAGLIASDTAHLSYPVLAFTGFVSLAMAVLSGLAPAIETSRTDMQEALKEGGRQGGTSVRHRRIRHGFVIAEVALAVVLLVGAGLMLRTFANLRGVNPGFDPHGVLTMRVSLPPAKYKNDDQRTRFFREVVDRVRALPGVTDAGAISFLPFAGLGAATDFTIQGRPAPPPGQDFVADVRVCDNGFFRTLRLPLVRGRLFTSREMRERSNVVVINHAMAERYFPGQDPLGQRLLVDMTSPIVPTEVVGVVGDAQLNDLTSEPRPLVYWPHPQLAYGAMTLTVRTASDPLSLALLVEREVHTLDKDQPVADVRSMEQWVGRSLAQTRFSSLLLSVFAALALLLAAVGIYGVMSYAVSQRTSEIGIRLALGASRRSILALVVRNGLVLAGAGLAMGVTLALMLTRALTSLLFETGRADPATFVTVVLLLAAVAILACYVPASRAARIAPVEALRRG
ncbi:MAG: ABC transporter permease [Betaproteobacteria bacterium]